MPGMFDPRSSDYNPVGGMWMNDPLEGMSEEWRAEHSKDVALRSIAEKLHIPRKYIFEEGARAAVLDILEDPSLESDEKLLAIVAYFDGHTSTPVPWTITSRGEPLGIESSKRRGSRRPGGIGHKAWQRYKKSKAGREETAEEETQKAARRRKMKELGLDPKIRDDSRGFFQKFQYCPECEEYESRSSHSHLGTVSY